MQKRTNLIFTGAAIAFGATFAYAELSGSYLVPLDHEAIRYAKTPVTDPIARLAQKVASGEVKLEFEDNGYGYLRSMLMALDLNVDSQVLVFSKTSFQAPRIGARTPRALYFNDSMSLGIVRGGDVLELAAVDPKQGVIFYSLDQERVDKPRFERRDTCLQCHQSGGTLGVPGIVVRSVYPEPSGMPIFNAGTYVSDHRSPLKERWGGWYVTGTHGDARHMGNAVVRDRDKPDQLEPDGTQNLTDLGRKFDTGAYLSPYSDIVALLTLEHQTHMTNLITRVNYETRMALHYQEGINKAFRQPDSTFSDSTKRRIDSAVEEMVTYMLFAEEIQLQAPVKGATTFAQTFARRGPRDRKGRSLRDFDLKTRIFKYPLTYMIYADNFDGMPEEAKARIYRRLFDVLTGKDTNKKFARLTVADRKAILEILMDTKAGLPGYWKAAPAVGL
ncbi:MAG: hypothetical protein HY820_05595 [Acidobacteria bacterium]|nr:hypothetical protein [Acidobacteriota bacterium]